MRRQRNGIDAKEWRKWETHMGDKIGGGETAQRDGVRRDGVTLEELRDMMAEFARERDWDQYHSPRNLLLAMVGEVGELSEIFQWKGEVPRGLPGWADDERQHLGEELSDVLLYLVRLSDICGINLGKATIRKINLNAIKYPAVMDPYKGSSTSSESDGGIGNHNENNGLKEGTIAD